MIHSITITTFLFMLGFSSLSSAACIAPEGVDKYRLSSDLHANQIYIEQLRSFEKCLFEQHEERYSREFTEKYNQQKAEEAALLRRINQVTSKGKLI